MVVDDDDEFARLDTVMDDRYCRSVLGWTAEDTGDHWTLGRLRSLDWVGYLGRRRVLRVAADSWEPGGM
jgi:hypothetical protein